MKKIATLLLMTAALGLSACGREASDEAPVENNSLEATPVETIPADEGEQAAPPRPAVNSSNAAEPPLPAPTISEDQQVQDDADAVGMTARLPREDEGASEPAENAF